MPVFLKLSLHGFRKGHQTPFLLVISLLGPQLCLAHAVIACEVRNEGFHVIDYSTGGPHLRTQRVNETNILTRVFFHEHYNIT